MCREGQAEAGPRLAAVAWAATVVRAAVVGMEETGDLGDDQVVSSRGRKPAGSPLGYIACGVREAGWSQGPGDPRSAPPEPPRLGGIWALPPTPEIPTVSKEGSGSTHPVWKLLPHCSELH